MNNEQLERELREIAVAISGLELANWAVMKSILIALPTAQVALKEIYPALMNSLSGRDVEEIKERINLHMERWIPD